MVSGTDEAEEAFTGGEPGKNAFHAIDPVEIRFGIVVAAALVRGQPKSARDIGVPGAGPAQMDHGG